MIRLFRKFKSSLRTDAKMGGYLAYATGEILLVVAGILIALNVNNWNETRKLERRMAGAKQRVWIELMANKADLIQDIERMDATYAAGIGWLELEAEGRLRTVRPEPTGNLMAMAVWQATTFSLEELVNMGSFAKLNDDSLINLINSYRQELNDLNEHVEFMNLQSQLLVDVIVREGDMLGTTAIPPFLPQKEEKTTIGFEAYYEQEFINRLAVKMISVNFVLREYRAALALMNELIDYLQSGVASTPTKGDQGELFHEDDSR